MRIGSLGIWEILLLLVIVLMVFGPKRLPEMAKNMGQAVREFRKGIRDMKDDIEREVMEDDKPVAISSQSTSDTVKTVKTVKEN